MQRSSRSLLNTILIGPILLISSVVPSSAVVSNTINTLPLSPGKDWSLASLRHPSLSQTFQFSRRCSAYESSLSCIRASSQLRLSRSFLEESLEELNGELDQCGRILEKPASSSIASRALAGCCLESNGVCASAALPSHTLIVAK